MTPNYTTDRQASATLFRSGLEDRGIPFTHIDVQVAETGRVFLRVDAPDPDSWASWIVELHNMAQGTPAKVLPLLSRNLFTVILILEAT